VKILRVLIDIGHPAHVHFFKNTIWNLEKKGHKVMVVSRDKDVVVSPSA
jgi:predicted glycosyltransferase